MSEKIRIQLPSSGVAEVYKQRRIVVVPKSLELYLKNNDVKFMSVKNKLAYRFNADNYVKTRFILKTVPPPMSLYYKWAGLWKPFQVQRITSYALSACPRMYVLNSMGTGKTLAALWAADYLMQERAIRRALVLSPLSTLRGVWGDHLDDHFSHRSYGTLHSYSKSKRLKVLSESHDFYILNHDGLRIVDVLQGLINMPDLDLIIVDEGAVFRDPRTTRWKALRKLVRTLEKRRRLWVWWMTGTPMPNAPTDVWAQVRLVTPDRIVPYYTGWRSETMYKVTPYRWAPKKDATQKCYQAMKPAVRFALEDCIDLPPLIYEFRDVMLTKEQKSAYTSLQTKLGVEIRGKSITPVNEGVKLGKLMQVCEGSVFTDDNQIIDLDNSTRIKEVEDIIDQVRGKVIVFANHVRTLERLHAHFPDSLLVHGGVSKTKRDEIFFKFQRLTHKHRILVAQPRTMTHGLTLTAATCIIWFGPPRGNETYLQANARIHRPGQKQKTVIVHLTSTRVERELYRRYKEQQSTQGLLLQAVREKIK